MKPEVKNKPKFRFTGFHLSPKLVFDRNLGWSKKILLQIVDSLSPEDGSGCFASDVYLAAALSANYDEQTGEFLLEQPDQEYSVKTVSNMVTDLVDLGYLVRTGYGPTRRLFVGNPDRQEAALKVSQKRESEKTRRLSQKRDSDLPENGKPVSLNREDIYNKDILKEDTKERSAEAVETTSFEAFLLKEAIPPAAAAPAPAQESRNGRFADLVEALEAIKGWIREHTEQIRYFREIARFRGDDTAIEVEAAQFLSHYWSNSSEQHVCKSDPIAFFSNGFLKWLINASRLTPIQTAGRPAIAQGAQVGTPQNRNKGTVIRNGKMYVNGILQES
jgi:hypothetical protein